MQHLAAFYQSANSAGVLTTIAAVPDQAIYTSGNDVRVPPDMLYLLWEAALSAQTGPGYGQLQSPSMRELVNQYISKIVNGVTFSAYDQAQQHLMNPRKLVANESVNAAVEATGGAAAANYVLMGMGDGAVKPVTGDIFTVRATGAAALAAGTWVNTPLTFLDTLPAGSYQVVGMRAQGPNMVAARIVFIGAGYRPGVHAVQGSGSQDMRNSRYGEMGVFGQFDTNQPPSIDCLGITDTSQVFDFDLIKVK